MPAGHASWIRRSMGLALSRHLLRRSLALHGAPGKAVLATILSKPVGEDAETTARMPAGAESARAAQG